MIIYAALAPWSPPEGGLRQLGPQGLCWQGSGLLLSLRTVQTETQQSPHFRCLGKDAPSPSGVSPQPVSSQSCSLIGGGPWTPLSTSPAPVNPGRSRSSPDPHPLQDRFPPMEGVMGRGPCSNLPLPRGLGALEGSGSWANVLTPASLLGRGLYLCCLSGPQTRPQNCTVSE